MEIRSFRCLFLCIIVAVSLSATARAQTQQQDSSLTPLQVAHIKEVEEAVISPNGKTIAYTVSQPADPLKENKAPVHHLFICNMADSTSRAFITSMNVNRIAFRPGQPAITFLGTPKGSEVNALYQIGLNGGEAKKLLSFPRSILGYSWADDGNHIAFMVREAVDLKNEGLPYHPEIFEENEQQRHGFVTNVAKKDHKQHKITIGGSIYDIEWAPNGSSLALAVAPTPRIDDYYMHQRIVITNHRGDTVKATVDHQGKLGEMAWSPDGGYLAMLASADIHDPAAGRLFVVPKTGGEPTMLSPDYQGTFEQFHWADSTTIRYLSSKGVWSTFGSINIDGTEMRTKIAPGETILHHFSQADDGTLAFLADKATHPQELYFMKPSDTKPARITNSNPWLQDISMGDQKVVTWKTKNGPEIQGILMYPTDYVEGNVYPMITVAHGGPESHFDNGWLTSYAEPGQVASRQGYFIFYPNYRGSTGRGLSFAESSQGDPAGAEFNDIVQGVEELVAESIADSTRLGITGGSYGGYATAWLSTRYTDIFSAGVMLAGISDNISKWGTSDIPEELYLVHNRQNIWDDYEKYLHQSPIYYAGQTKTPLLIAAGKEDTRVDPSQSYELYRHIKTRTDTPVRLVLYPGEGHGNKRSTARYDYNMRMMRWFNDYLKVNPKRPKKALDIGK